MGISIMTPISRLTTYTFDEARSNMSDVVTSKEFETDLYDFDFSNCR